MASSDDPEFDRSFSAAADRLEELTPLIRRMVANNPGPFTYTGTCTYVVGQGRVAVIDPGPDDPAHLDALLQALGTETVTQIVVTHTHADHSPGARSLKDRTGAPIVGCGPHIAARPLADGETNFLDASADRDHRPDWLMADGDELHGDGWTLRALATPGHCANHLAFALPQENALFSGDHVMAWSTSIVAPPDGSMRDYMASLEKLRNRPETIYWPGHGGPVRQPQRFVRALIQHRRQREAAILRQLETGSKTIPQIVLQVYDGIAPALTGAAGLSVFAQLEDLVERGEARCDGPARIDATYARGG